MSDYQAFRVELVDKIAHVQINRQIGRAHV